MEGGKAGVLYSHLTDEGTEAQKGLLTPLDRTGIPDLILKLKGILTRAATFGAPAGNSTLQRGDSQEQKEGTIYKGVHRVEGKQGGERSVPGPAGVGKSFPPTGLQGRREGALTGTLVRAMPLGEGHQAGALAKAGE